MDANQYEDQVDSTHSELEPSPAKPTAIKRLKLVRQIIRVSSHLRAGEGCYDTGPTNSGHTTE